MRRAALGLHDGKRRSRHDSQSNALTSTVIIDFARVLVRKMESFAKGISDRIRALERFLAVKKHKIPAVVREPSTSARAREILGRLRDLVRLRNLGDFPRELAAHLGIVRQGGAGVSGEK